MLVNNKNLLIREGKLTFANITSIYLSPLPPQVVPYTSCQQGMEPQPFSQSVLAPKLFTEKTCTQGKKVSLGLDQPLIYILGRCFNEIWIVLWKVFTMTIKFLNLLSINLFTEHAFGPHK